MWFTAQLDSEINLANVFLKSFFRRHIFKRDNLHLCGAGNAARLHIAVQHDRVITRARQQLHLGFKQAEQPCVGAFFAA